MEEAAERITDSVWILGHRSKRFVHERSTKGWGRAATARTLCGARTDTGAGPLPFPARSRKASDTQIQ